MYELPFAPDERDIKEMKRPFPWIPKEVKPKFCGRYLIACYSLEKAAIGYYRESGWQSICSSKEIKDITHWAELPSTPKDQCG